MADEEKIWELVQMCYYGHLDQVKQLLDDGVDVNCVANGYTPLRAAREGVNPKIADYLLSVGAKEKKK